MNTGWNHRSLPPEVDLLMDWPELKYPSPPQEEDLLLAMLNPRATLSPQLGDREDTQREQIQVPMSEVVSWSPAVEDRVDIGLLQSPTPPLHHTSLPVYPGVKDSSSVETLGTSIGNVWSPPQRKFPSTSCDEPLDRGILNSQDRKVVFG